MSLKQMPHEQVPLDLPPDHVSPGHAVDKLVYMANQIGRFFRSQGEAVAVSGTADHVRKFWDPRMRVAIFAHLKAGGVGLDPLVRQALEQLEKAAADIKTRSPA
jgi:formate dehydrogenase subunit delta